MLSGTENHARAPFHKATITVNGIEEPQWAFSLSSLPGDHIVSIALAPDDRPEAKEVRGVPTVDHLQPAQPECAACMTSTAYLFRCWAALHA